MKIVYLHQYFATKKSVTSTRSYVFAKYLVEQGHEVVVITTENFLKGKYLIKKTLFKITIVLMVLKLELKLTPTQIIWGQLNE